MRNKLKFSYVLMLLWVTIYILGFFTNIYSLFECKGINIVNGEYYRFFTGLLLHVNWLHLLVNIMAAYFVGVYLEDKVSRLKIALFSLIISIMTNIIFSIIYPDSMSIGGSPIIFALIGMIFSIQLFGTGISKFRLGTWYGNWIVAYAILANIPIFSKNISTLVIHAIAFVLGSVATSLLLKMNLLTKENQNNILMRDDFVSDELNLDYWIPYYLPQWSSREASKANYYIKDGILTLYLADTTEPWCPEWNGDVRVSNLQTGVFSGKVGEKIGQHQFHKDLVVREEQKKEMKVTPLYGRIEFRCRCHISEENVAALWMIGTEVEPTQAAEICIFELKGWNIKEKTATIGYGIHPFGDHRLKNLFYEKEFPVDVTEWNTYACEWRENEVEFFINGKSIDIIPQAPDYPMQLMLDLYDIKNIKNESNRFEIDYIEIQKTTK